MPNDIIADGVTFVNYVPEVPAQDRVHLAPLQGSIHSVYFRASSAKHTF